MSPHDSSTVQSLEDASVRATPQVRNREETTSAGTILASPQARG
jgi:hypothetical protein